MPLQLGCNRSLLMTQSEMHGGNAIEYWHELHKRQSDWAFRAYGRLIQTLSEDVQEKLALKTKRRNMWSSLAKLR